MKRLFRVAICALLLSVIATAADNDPKVLLQLDRDFAVAFTAKGIDGWIQFMAPNAVELDPEPLVGIDQMKAGLGKGIRRSGCLTWVPMKAEFVGKGGVGYTVGRYQQTSTAPTGNSMSSVAAI